MAKEFLEKLSDLIRDLKIEDEVALPMETKHFFNGAALYVNKKICASWSPVGLAFKLPDPEVHKLIDCGKAKPLKYFPNGHVKKGYALFEITSQIKTHQWKKYFIKAVQQS